MPRKKPRSSLRPGSHPCPAHPLRAGAATSATTWHCSPPDFDFVGFSASHRRVRGTAPRPSGGFFLRSRSAGFGAHDIVSRRRGQADAALKWSPAHVRIHRPVESRCLIASPPPLTGKSNVPTRRDRDNRFRPAWEPSRRAAGRGSSSPVRLRSSSSAARRIHQNPRMNRRSIPCPGPWRLLPEETALSIMLGRLSGNRLSAGSPYRSRPPGETIAVRDAVIVVSAVLE